MALTQQDIRTLHGVITAIADGRKGPAKGGLLNGDEATLLRTLLSEHAQARVPSESGPVRGLARLLRRNPTDAERTFWDAMVRDRRFVGKGFKRQVPVGPHVADIVSFPLKTVIELIPHDETRVGASARSSRRAWLTERGYRVADVFMGDVEADVQKVLDGLAESCSFSPSTP
jgi:tRNA/rRNA methyltransferase